MNAAIAVIVIAGALLLILAALSIRIVAQYEKGVLFRPGRRDQPDRAQTTLRKVVGQHTLDEALADTCPKA